MSGEARYRILLVDDDAEDRLLVEDLLGEIRPWSAEMVWARSYDEAVALLETAPPFDVALVDYRLGARRGVELLAEPALRRANLPVVVLTGQPSAEVDAAALAAGADDFLAKRELTAAALERSIRYTVETRRRHRNEARYRTLIETARDLVAIVDAQGAVQYVSPSIVPLLGRRPDEAVFRELMVDVHPEDRSEVLRTFDALVHEPGTVRQIQYRMRHADQSWRVFDTVWQNLLDDPVVAGVVVTSWDVTELRRTQDTLAETAGMLQQTLSCLADAVFTVDLRTRTILRANDSTFEIFRRAREELIGMSTRLIHVSDEAFDDFGDRIREGMRESDRFRGRIDLRRGDGTIFPAEFTISRMRPEERIGDRVVAVIRDLSDRIAEERRLQFQAALIASVGQPVMAVDREARVTYWNRACEVLTGLSGEEVMGTQVLQRIVHAVDQDTALAARARVLAGDEWTGELALVDREGNVRTVQTTITPAINPDGTPGGRIAAGVDITALRETEQERRREAERAHFAARLLDAVGQSVIAVDPDGIITYWNHAAEVLYGWTAAEAIGRPAADVTPTTPSRAQTQAIESALERGQAWTGELEVRGKGERKLPALVTDAPLLDDAGQRVGVVRVTSDLSERKELEAQLRQAQKMEAIGRLAGGVAHDFNNLLTAITGHARMLLEDMPASSPLADDVRQILSAGDRAAVLTRQLLAFSRKQVLEQRAVDMRRLVRDMQQMLRRLIPERIELVVDTDDEPIIARADPGQVGQVLMNLVVNAGDAIADAGRITIDIRNVGMTPERAAEIPWTVEPGDYAQLTVRDTGSGIPDDVMERIFEPFFTTKAEGRGTGLGLSTVYGIVKQSGGHVVVDSRGGVGTTFCVLLPVASEAPVEPQQERAPTPPRRDALVLLVEDDTSVRNLAVRVLERLGYRVVTATNGREALEIASSQQGIDLVVSDVVMPEMSGGELVDRLRAAHPDLKVVLTSGYSEADLKGQVRQKGDAFLVKPFTPDGLTRVVAAVLNS